MGETAIKIATYDDLYSIPENMTGEIIDGKLIASPRPSRRHGHTSSILGGEIVPPFFMGRGGPGGWVILVEPEIAFGDNILVPDLASWKKERFPLDEEHNWISIIPDWVCEIVSPGSVRMDRVSKRRLYGQYRVAHYWIVDPVSRTVEVMRNEAGQWLIIGTYGDNDTMRAEPFQEIAIALDGLWLGGAEEGRQESHPPR